jgi:ABC-2 type transport system permease protein
MHRLFTIARHEFKMTAANKAFVIITIIGPFLILAVTVLPGLLAADPTALAKNSKIAVAFAEGADRIGAGTTDTGLRQAAGAISPATQPAAIVEAMRAALLPRGVAVEGPVAVAEGRKRVQEGRLAGLLVLAPSWAEGGRSQFLSKSGSEVVLYGTVEAAMAVIAREAKIRESGIDPAVMARILADPGLDVIRLKGATEEKADKGGFLSALFTAISFVMLLYMTTLLYGQLIGRSVVTEKTSKTVEIILSSVSSRELMFGKILGMGLAGVLQYAVWVAMGLLLVKVIGPAAGIAVPASINPASLGWLALFFILAFFLYASAYAALGAAAEDEQHLGQLAWPLLVFLIVPLVMISALVMNPGSTVSRVLSLFPMTSPIVMLVRVLVSSPPAWELVLCLCLLVAAIYGMALLASRIFRTGILMTGKRKNLGEILRWMGEK